MRMCVRRGINNIDCVYVEFCCFDFVTNKTHMCDDIDDINFYCKFRTDILQIGFIAVGVAVPDAAAAAAAAAIVVVADVRVTNFRD